MSSEQPPNYSLQETPGSSGTTPAAAAPQIVITPLPNEVQFQSGNLGADDEPAAVEGEVQLKGLNSDDWDRLVITLRTVETMPSQSVELGALDVQLWSRKEVGRALPSDIAFSVPLMPDAPQTISTPTSSLTHTLAATLFPIGTSRAPMKKEIPIQIRRFSLPWNPPLHPAPILLNIDEPVPLTVQLPRSAFRAGEMIPLYFTVPPPSRSVFERGIQLRNVTAEMVRVVEIGPVNASRVEAASEAGSSSTTGNSSALTFMGSQPGVSYEKAPIPLSTLPPPRQTSTTVKQADESIHETVITRSGASCRLNPNRAVQLRLILHSSTQSDLDIENEAVPPDVDTAAGSITQSTVLHRVSFYVQVHVMFLSQADHTAKSVHGMIPIVIVPALAQQVDIQAEYEQTYMKKHDRPPMRTLRSVDDGTPQPPPFFEETVDGLRTPGVGVNPPPFSVETTSASGNELPSFLESQAAASGSRFAAPTPMTAAPYGSVPQQPQGSQSGQELRFDGEGGAFGFKPEDQYDGLSHSMMMSPPERPETPPPAMSSSIHDPNVTALAELITHEPRPLMGGEGPRPPPPPAMDDPMDPPPAIDDGYRMVDPPGIDDAHHLSVPTLPPPAHPSNVEPPPPSAGVDGGPPPYLGAPGGVSSAPPAYLDSH